MSIEGVIIYKIVRLKYSCSQILHIDKPASFKSRYKVVKFWRALTGTTYFECTPELLGRSNPPNIVTRLIMARGNQRELARLKNLKKQEEAKKSQKQGDKNKRMETDAERMRAKQAAGM